MSLRAAMPQVSGVSVILVKGGSIRVHSIHLGSVSITHIDKVELDFFFVKTALFGQCAHSCERSAPIDTARPTAWLSSCLTSYLCEPNHTKAIQFPPCSYHVH